MLGVKDYCFLFFGLLPVTIYEVLYYRILLALFFRFLIRGNTPCRMEAKKILKCVGVQH